MATNEPVLLIAFNRPDLLVQVIDRLRSVEPTAIYFAVDGARADRPEEKAKVDACRVLAAAFDWPCEVKTLFHEKNLGCGLGVSTAITWFFANVERGIILEDDIVPDPSFFPFCSELLDRYADDERVQAISGCNFVPASAQSDPGQAYRFSQVAHIWGWATWRRSWARYRLDIAGWRQELPPIELWKRAGHSVPASVYWGSTFELLARKEVDTWDGQFVFAAMVAGQLTATSNVNLIENIGFGSTATHTFEDRDELQPIEPIRHPTAAAPVVLDAKADAWTRRKHFGATWLGLVHQGYRYFRQRQGRSK